MTHHGVSLVIPKPPPPPPEPKPWSLPAELDEEDDPFKEKRIQKELQFRMVGAIERADNSSLENYIKSGVDTNAKIQLVKTPLTLALEQDEISADIISTLLSGGADPNLPDFTPRRTAPLHIIACRGDIDAARILINQSKDEVCDLEIRDKAGCTPLHYAAKYGNMIMVELLLKQGVDIHSKDYSGCSALHRACESLHYNTAEYLIDVGHDIDVVDSFKWTPLFHSVFSLHTDMVKMLLKHGADVSVLDARNNSLWDALCYHEHWKVSWNFSPLQRIVDTSFDYYERAWAIPPQELKDYLMEEVQKYQSSPNYMDTRRLELMKVLINTGLNPSLYPACNSDSFALKELVYMRFYSILAGAKSSLDEKQMVDTMIHKTIEPATIILKLLTCLDRQITEQYSLKRQCRDAIRNSLAPTRDINGTIVNLPIPNALKSYLRLDELNDFLD